MAPPLKHACRSLRIVSLRTLRAVTYFCVVLSMWQAPVPWLHAHQGTSDLTHSLSYTPFQDANRELMARWDREVALHSHLVTHHTRSTPQELHLHFVMLADLLRGAGCPIPLKHGVQNEEPTNLVVPSSTLSFGTELLRANLPIQRYEPAAFLVISTSESQPTTCGLLSQQSLGLFTIRGTLLTLLSKARC